jgi:hypothetical protein
MITHVSRNADSAFQHFSHTWKWFPHRFQISLSSAAKTASNCVHTGEDSCCCGWFQSHCNPNSSWLNKIMNWCVVAIILKQQQTSSRIEANACNEHTAKCWCGVPTNQPGQQQCNGDLGLDSKIEIFVIQKTEYCCLLIVALPFRSLLQFTLLFLIYPQRSRMPSRPSFHR